MKEHPGHFWICLFLFCITLNSCDQAREAEKQTKIMSDWANKP